MLELKIERGGKSLSLQLPMPIEVLAGELRAIGIHEPLSEIRQSEFTLQFTSGFGKHFMKLVQPDDTLHRIAAYCNVPGSLAATPLIQLSELVMADRFRDFDHMADYLQYGPDAIHGLMRLSRDDRSVVLPTSQINLFHCFGAQTPPGLIRLAEMELAPVSELGKRLMAEFQPYSDTVAIANLACDLVKHPAFAQADLGKFMQGVRVFQMPMPTETISFICPLTVSVEDGDSGDLVESDHYLLDDHEDEIRDALQDELPGDENMADYLPDELKPKIASMEWGVTSVRGTLYGSISCELRAPLTDGEQARLTDWITGQSSDGLGEVVEQHPVDTDDGELYVHFWHSGDDYFVMPSEDFFQQLHEQEQGFGGMGGMA
jgi:hypothetical protein